MLTSTLDTGRLHRHSHSHSEMEDETGRQYDREANADEGQTVTDDDNDMSSSDASVDKDMNESAWKRARVEEDDEPEDDDHREDAMSPGTSKQSKRKPSKSRIKRIIQHQTDDSQLLSPEVAALLPTSSLATATDLPQTGNILPPINSMIVNSSCSLMGPPSMIGSVEAMYMQMQASQSNTPGSYKCTICSKEFRVPSRFESHMLSHAKGKPYCCDTCGKLFATEQKLEIHRPVHSRDRKDSFSCPQCGHICSNWRAYLYHVSKHTINGGKKHTCQICGRQFHAYGRLKNHLQNHMHGKHFCCTICGKLFESQKKLDMHLLIHDSDRQGSYQCSDCSKLYDDWRAFKQHMKTHRTEGVIYHCEVCQEEFVTQYEKEKHKRVHTSPQRHQCPHCSKCFRSQIQMRVHVRRHLGNSGHECTVCGHEFSRLSSLKQHMLVHDGDGEFFCHDCGMTFGKAEELSSHMVTHSKEREFVCDQCGKTFANKVHHHRHLMVHAAGQLYSCRLCGKQFASQTFLTAHAVLHSTSGRKRHACLACSEAFDEQLQLEAHAHTHGKCPPFVCGLCGKQFAEQRYFRQHMKRHQVRKYRQQGRMAPVLNLATFPSPLAASPCGPGSVGSTADATSIVDKALQCSLCLQQVSSSQELATHVEEHKTNGLLMYLNMFQPHGAEPQTRVTSTDDSDEDSETDSDTDDCQDSIITKNQAIPQYDMSAPTVESSSSKSGVVSEAAERAMTLRMQQTMCFGPSHSSSSVAASTSQQALDSCYYSAPVFPGQMSSSGSGHATPYHAAAQPFQHDAPQGELMNDSGGLQAGGDVSVSRQLHHGLPGFNNFCQSLTYPTSGAFQYADTLGQSQYTTS